MRGPTIIRAGLLALALLGAGAAPSWGQDADEVRSILRSAAASEGANAAQLIRVVGCETGGRYHADAIGDGGTSFGLAQLHRGGLLDSGRSSFYGRGFDDPFNATQAAAYMAWAFANGLASHWSCR